MYYIEKPKQTFKKRGQEYTRKGYDIKVKTADKFKKKCHLVGLNETQLIEMLVENFCQATGWGEQVKTPPFFEQRAKEHIREAVGYTVKDVDPYQSLQNNT
jgi:hypothetical protein